MNILSLIHNDVIIKLLDEVFVGKYLGGSYERSK